MKYPSKETHVETRVKAHVRTGYHLFANGGDEKAR